MNLIGSFLLGWITGGGLSEQMALFLGNGIHGSFYNVLHLQTGEREPVSARTWDVHGSHVLPRHWCGLAGIWCGNVTHLSKKKWRPFGGGDRNRGLTCSVSWRRMATAFCAGFISSPHDASVCPWMCPCHALLGNCIK